MNLKQEARAATGTLGDLVLAALEEPRTLLASQGGSYEERITAQDRIRRVTELLGGSPEALRTPKGLRSRLLEKHGQALHLLKNIVGDLALEGRSNLEQAQIVLETIRQYSEALSSFGVLLGEVTGIKRSLDQDFIEFKDPLGYRGIEVRLGTQKNAKADFVLLEGPRNARRNPYQYGEEHFDGMAPITREQFRAICEAYCARVMNCRLEKKMGDLVPVTDDNISKILHNMLTDIVRLWDGEARMRYLVGDDNTIQGFNIKWINFEPPHSLGVFFQSAPGYSRTIAALGPPRESGWDKLRHFLKYLL
jgi:hypothetical protein